jgi:hypothetical protein
LTASRQGLEDRMPDIVEYSLDGGGSVLVAVDQ